MLTTAGANAGRWLGGKQSVSTREDCLSLSLTVLRRRTWGTVLKQQYGIAALLRGTLRRSTLR